MSTNVDGEILSISGFEKSKSAPEFLPARCFVISTEVDWSGEISHCSRSAECVKAVQIKTARDVFPPRRDSTRQPQRLKDDQVSVFFAPADFLHSAFSWANCSAERITFACLRYVLRLSFVQHALMH